MEQRNRELMNTRQVAGYLGINEKKNLCWGQGRRIPLHAGEGKGDVSRKLIDAWIEKSAVPPSERELRPEPAFNSCSPLAATIQASRFCASF